MGNNTKEKTNNMKEQEIIENNKLIAEFMDMEWRDEPFNNFFFKGLNVGDLKFNESWDWLMPVIEKISTVKFPDDVYPETGNRTYIEQCYPRTFGMRDENGYFMFRLNGYSLYKSEKLIESAYNSVVEFIISYNETKTS